MIDQPPPELIARALANDERVLEAKKLLRSALKEHQKKITAIKPPVDALKKGYEELLSSLTEERGNKLWLPYIGSGIGNGPFVELADGSIKYDFICGIGVHYWGHNHPDLLDSGVDAAISNTVMQGNFQQNIDSAQLSSLFLKISRLDHCFLCSSGALANENAFKIAFQKNFPANRILSFERCFMGRTLAGAQITDKPGFRDGLPMTLSVDYIPFYDTKDPEGSTKRSVEALKKHIQRYPKQHALMCFELVQGEAGFYAGTREFFIALMSILKENKIAVFADEIQSFGRTSQPFAYQHFDLQSYIDIATVGKLAQTCATLFTSEYNPRPALLGHTFTSSTSAIKAGIVILSKLLNGDFYGPNGKIMRLNRHFTSKLEGLANRYPHLIQGPFGLGAMIGFTPYGGDEEKVKAFIHRLFHAGVISFMAGGGVHPARVRLLMPVEVVAEKEIDHVVEIIEAVLKSD